MSCSVTISHLKHRRCPRHQSCKQRQEQSPPPGSTQGCRGPAGWARRPRCVPPPPQPSANASGVSASIWKLENRQKDHSPGVRTWQGKKSASRIEVHPASLAPVAWVLQTQKGDPGGLSCDCHHVSSLLWWFCYHF